MNQKYKILKLLIKMNNPNENMITKYDQYGEIDLIEDENLPRLEILNLQMQINNLGFPLNDYYGMIRYCELT